MSSRRRDKATMVSQKGYNFGLCPSGWTWLLTLHFLKKSGTQGLLKMNSVLCGTWLIVYDVVLNLFGDFDLHKMKFWRQQFF